MFSVIIPVKNDFRISACLDSIFGQLYSIENYEVIVIEDGDQKLEKELCASRSHSNLRYISIPKGGSFNARNIGIKMARNEICAFIDADCSADPNWLKHAEEYFRKERNVIVGGSIKLRTSIKMNGVEFFESLFYLNQEDYFKKYGFFATANFFCSKKLFTQFGSFEGIAIAEEEREFCSRLGKEGVGLVYAQDVIVHHPAQNRLWRFIKRIVRDSLCQQTFKKQLYSSSFSLIKQKMRTIHLYFSRIYKHEGQILLRLQAINIIFLIVFINVIILMISPLLSIKRKLSING